MCHDVTKQESIPSKLPTETMIRKKRNLYSTKVETEQARIDSPNFPLNHNTVSGVTLPRFKYSVFYKLCDLEQVNIACAPSLSIGNKKHLSNIYIFSLD